MKKLFFMKKLLFFLFISSIAYAQNLDYNNSYESIRICTAIQGNNFASEKAADNALDKILAVIGASKRFVLQECSNINNAVALTYNGVRYIMYDPEFMRMINYSNDWSNMFILAHEVGHHINGHTVDVLAVNSSNEVSLSTRRIQELEADEFAGFVLGRLGATLTETLYAVQSLSDEEDSYSTHPKRSNRIAAIKKGFNKSGGYLDTSGDSVKNGEIVESPYSNSRFSGVEFVNMDYDEGVYRGYIGINSGKPFGYGEHRNTKGDIYEGEWSDGNYNGYGKLTGVNGNSHEGYFVNGMASGEGVTTFYSGVKHIGIFSEYKLKKGIVIEEDNQTEGTFESGSVILVTTTFNNDNKPIKWGFLDGSNGNGYTTFTHVDGTKIKANFSDGKITAQRGLLGGEFGTSNEKNYIGKYRGYKTKFVPTFVFDFIPIQIQQELDMTNAEIYSFERLAYYSVESALQFLERHINQKIYNSNLSNSVEFYGRGNLKANDHESAEYIEERWGGYTYAGETLGYGETTFPDGAVHKGYFFSGYSKDKAGYGEIFYTENDSKEYYKGMFWNDIKNGFGIMKYKNGKIEKGVFKNNIFIKSEEFDFELMQKTFKTWY